MNNYKIDKTQFEAVCNEYNKVKPERVARVIARREGDLNKAKERLAHISNRPTYSSKAK